MSQEDDNALHQIALSLLHEPQAKDALAKVQANEELWQELYQPFEVSGERSDGEKRQLIEAAAEAATDLHPGSFSSEKAANIDDFYIADLLLRAQGSEALGNSNEVRKGIVVDIDMSAWPWMAFPTST
eukprot:CAMPEP_0178460122 /NCGR_PEP_ID=MMETSP0689_2-20121128/48511_1 /TAXON_ID=160604 /ORGANISM="Amphidinium massartii, Strain CS-259" /LENGTH=127 /DNA_ID=CAMNT_0020086677 /DNA_START=90 /DNA_END=470 /DNA_ORIENTATION=+